MEFYKRNQTQPTTTVSTATQTPRTNFNSALRVVIDFKEVMSNSLTSILLEDIVASGEYSRNDKALEVSDLKDLANKVKADISINLDSLVAALQNDLEK